FFLFQAEDGIRDRNVTGVQTCALPISHPLALSGGQKQRLAIVDGCLSGKELLIFDEPTSGLDHAHMLEVSRLLRELAERGLCVLVITHDGEFLRESGAQTAEWVPKERHQ